MSRSLCLPVHDSLHTSCSDWAEWHCSPFMWNSFKSFWWHTTMIYNKENEICLAKVCLEGLLLHPVTLSLVEAWPFLSAVDLSTKWVYSFWRTDRFLHSVTLRGKICLMSLASRVWWYYSHFAWCWLAPYLSLWGRSSPCPRCCGSGRRRGWRWAPGLPAVASAPWSAPSTSPAARPSAPAAPPSGPTAPTAPPGHLLQSPAGPPSAHIRQTATGKRQRETNFTPLLHYCMWREMGYDTRKEEKETERGQMNKNENKRGTSRDL